MPAIQSRYGRFVPLSATGQKPTAITVPVSERRSGTTSRRAGSGPLAWRREHHRPRAAAAVQWRWAAVPVGLVAFLNAVRLHGDRDLLSEGRRDGLKPVTPRDRGHVEPPARAKNAPPILKFQFNRLKFMLMMKAGSLYILDMSRNSRGRPVNAPPGFIHPCRPRGTETIGRSAITV
jgi:hypothetical protein